MHRATARSKGVKGNFKVNFESEATLSSLLDFYLVLAPNSLSYPSWGSSPVQR